MEEENIISKNPHWTREMWEREREGTMRCITETENLLKEVEDNKMKKPKLDTLEDFSKMMDLKKKLEKVENKKIYLTNLKKKLEQIDNFLNE